jgi:hypothetical protein
MRIFSLIVMTVGSLATGWLSSQDLQAQVGHSAAAPMQVWNQTSQGMSSNAALAFYRVQNVGGPAGQTSAWPQYSRIPSTVNYPTSPSVANAFYPTPNMTSVQFQKPFAYVRPARTTFDRYWPYLLEGYEDPETGYIIWTLP